MNGVGVAHRATRHMQLTPIERGKSMIKYFCRDCKEWFDEWELIPGRTISEDEYTNAACPSCLSDEDIEESSEEGMCPCCNFPHDPDWPGDWEKCMEGLYSDSRAIIYMMANASPGEIQANMEQFSGKGTTATLKEIINESGETMEFVKWICEYDEGRGVWEWDSAKPKYMEELREAIRNIGRAAT